MFQTQRFEPSFSFLEATIAEIYVSFSNLEPHFAGNNERFSVTFSRRYISIRAFFRPLVFLDEVIRLKGRERLRNELIL